MEKPQPQLSEILSPERGDDFTRIRGIGPGIESRLRGANIVTYAQLAAQTPESLAGLLKGMAVMSVSRVIEQDWLGQARALALEAQREPAKEPEAIREVRQHYENFTVELLLDEENTVRRTRVIHVQSQEEKVWAGWEEAKLGEFLKAVAAVRTAEEAAVPVSSGPEIKPKTSSSPDIPSEIPPEKAVPKPRRVRILKLEPFETRSGQRTRMLLAGTPFDLRLILDLSELAEPVNRPLEYTASFYAKRVGNGENRLIGTVRGTVMPARQVPIQLVEVVLSKGYYRPEALVELTPPSRKSEGEMDLSAFLEGGLLQIC